MKIDQLPHWAIDQLEEHYPQVIDDDNADAMKVQEVVGDPSKDFYVLVSMGNGKLTLQLRQTLDKPVMLWDEEGKEVLATCANCKADSGDCTCNRYTRVTFKGE